MKHLPNVKNRLRSQPKLLNGLEFQIEADKLFNQNLHQLQLMKRKSIKVMKVVIIKN
jgi:hypothetical protein